jgi:hypothetical protein
MIAQDRGQKLFPGPNKDSFFVRHEARFLPGIFVMGASVDRAAAAKGLDSARSVVNSLISTPPSAGELELAKSNALATLNQQLFRPEVIGDSWLDSDSYSVPGVDDQLRALNAVTVADLQRVAARLFREAPFASVVVGNATELKAALSATQKIEVEGEVAGPQVAPQKPTTNAVPKTKRTTPILPAPKNPNPLMKNTKPLPPPD